MCQISDNEYITNLESHNCDDEIRYDDGNGSSSGGDGSGGGGGGGDDDDDNNNNNNAGNDNTTITKKRKRIATTYDNRPPINIENHLTIQNKNNRSKKKQIQQQQQHISLPFRILGRRYSLTKTGYKFLDISIVLKYPSSYVDVTLGSSHNKGISFSPDTWKKLLEWKHHIISYLQCDKRDASAFLPLYVGEITINFGQINSVPTLRLKTPTGRLTVCKDTMLRIFNFEHCVNLLTISLSAIVDNIDAKILQFYKFASTAKEPAKAIQDNESLFNCNDIIDCELTALLFPLYITTF